MHHCFSHTKIVLEKNLLKIVRFLFLYLWRYNKRVIFVKSLEYNKFE